MNKPLVRSTFCPRLPHAKLSLYSVNMAAKTNDKQAIFVREYLADRNGTRAAIAAGYAPKSASVTSCRLLRNAKVQAEVSEFTEQRLERLEVTADAVIQELAKVAFANIGDYLTVGTDGNISVDISRITPVQAAALADLRIDEYSSSNAHIRRTPAQAGIQDAGFRAVGQTSQALDRPA